MKILILKFRNIGDVLLITPLINNLKLYYPQAKIDVAVNLGTEQMLELNPNIDNIITYARVKIKALPIFKKLWSEVKFALNFKGQNYNMVINLTEGDRGSLISWLCGAKTRIGYKNNSRLLHNIFTYNLPKQEFRHTIETNLDPLRLLNIPIVDKKVAIFWDKKDELFVKEKLSDVKQFIHIHPVSRWLFKCIDDKTFAKIIDYCEDKLDIKVVVTAAPVKTEINKVDNILNLCSSQPLNLAGKLNLKQVAILNKKSQIFIGVDTAIMHIAAANDIPVLAFFGPSGTDHWGPWDNNLTKSTYLKRNGLQTMGKHKVFAEQNDCQPCGKDGCNGSKISDCLMSLDINIIKKNINKMLNAKTN